MIEQTARVKEAAVEYLTVGEVAKKLKMSLWTVHRLIRAGEIAIVRFGAGKKRLHPRIAVEELARFIKERTRR